MTSVAVVEDNQTVRETLARWINSVEDLRCACTCATGKEALIEIPRFRPDVVLMDIKLPGESGITCTARLKEQLPNLQVIMVTVYQDHELIFQALKAGACGYLLKRSTREEIVRAITEVKAGGAPMTGEVARRVIEVFQQPLLSAGQTTGLSRREVEVLELLAQGLANKRIAEKLGISYETVCVHLRRIYDKLHVRSRSEAIVKYFKDQGPSSNRLLQPESVDRAPLLPAEKL